MYSRRVGIPVDRFLRQAHLLGYYPEELFAEKFGVCVRVVVNYDISMLPKDDTE